LKNIADIQQNQAYSAKTYGTANVIQSNTIQITSPKNELKHWVMRLPSG